MEIERVLDEYRVGDIDERLSLFLSYRDLREEFTGIEEQISTDSEKKKSSVKKS